MVTHEVVSDSKKKIKIPNACIGLGVTVMSPYEMLRIEKARFVLGGMDAGEDADSWRGERARTATRRTLERELISLVALVPGVKVPVVAGL